MKKSIAVFLLISAFCSSACADDRPPAASPPASFEGYSKSTRTHVHVDLNADATYVETVDYTLKVLDKNGIDDVTTQSVSYSNSLTDIEVVAAYTQKADGRRIDVPKENFQVESNTGDKGNSPIISDITTKSVVFPDVSVGDTINFTYKLIQKEALFPGQFSYAKTFSDAYVHEDSEFSVTAPESLPIRVEARGVKGGEIAKENGKRRWVWHYENHEIAKPERPSVATFDFGPRILVSTFKDYAELAAAYEARAKPKSAVTDRIRKLADEITKGAKDERDTARLLYDWVAKNIRYAGNCIGIGSVVPHDTDHILDNKIGDCKDHTALLQALLAAKGIDSTPVLVNSGLIYSIPDIPTIEVFNHVINYIPSLKLYADSTSELTPFGSLPIPEEGKSVLHTEKFDGIKQTPATDNSKHWGKLQADITFDEEGNADGEIKVTMSGMFAEGMGRAFEQLKIDPKMEENVRNGILTQSGFKGNVSFVSFDAPDTQATTFHYTLRFHLENALNVPGPGAVYIYPFLKGQGVPISNFITPVSAEPQKHAFPCLGGATTEEITFHMPKGVKVLAVPKDVHTTWKYGTYDSVYKQKGSEITSVRKLVDTTPGNVCAAEIDDAARPFSATVTKDMRAQLVFN